MTEYEEIQIFYRNVRAIEKELNKRSIYYGDPVLGRMKNGVWIETILSGVDPEEDSPFYIELPNGSLSYYDMIASNNDTDFIGTDAKIESQLTEADIHSWY